MAKMCVKTRRIDVALVCLGHMRNARAANAVRDSIQRNEHLDLQAASLAIQLDMLVCLLQKFNDFLMILGRSSNHLFAKQTL